MSDLQHHIGFIRKHFEDGLLIRILLSEYRGSEPGLKKIKIEPAIIKGELRLKWVLSYQTKDITSHKNLEETIQSIQDFIHFHAFRSLQICTTEADVIGAWKSEQVYISRKARPSLKPNPTLQHDKEKQRTIPSGASFLQALGITDATGKVFKNAQDKFKQINHFIALLKPALEIFPQGQTIRAYDMGCGKGYLTFALYQYLQEQGYPLFMQGIEIRKDLTDNGNAIANACGFDQLHFSEGNIGSITNAPMDILVALHACDTATDEAIAKGILNGARVIVVAPCCHKQIRRTLEQSGGAASRKALTRFGIFLEREAEMLTDALRALVLEYYGYKVKVQQFISDAHTPKNIMILATKENKKDQTQSLETYNQLKKDSGISFHHLETLLPELGPLIAPN